MSYVQSFSVHARDIFEYFRFEEFAQQLDSSNLLYQVVQKSVFETRNTVELSNFCLGIIFEELIRKLAEIEPEEAG